MPAAKARPAYNAEMTMSHVRMHAEQVRWWAEEKAGDGHRLQGWCARASAELWRRLHKEGIHAEIHMWVDPSDGVSSHVFLVVDDHVVDVTATQFEAFINTDVVIEHKKVAEAEHKFYNTKYIYFTAADLRKEQVRQGWPKDQVAYTR